MNIKIHTQGWSGSQGKAKGEEAGGSIHVALEIDGKVFLDVTRVALVASSDNFTKVVATLIPGELETVVHDKDSWAALVQDCDDPEGAVRRGAYRGSLPEDESRRSPA